jgi:Glyoxalase/Bleomycin resistance protein/Dioxygenase superfamily
MRQSYYFLPLFTLIRLQKKPSFAYDRRKMPQYPFKRLVYIYIGSATYQRDYDFYHKVLGAELIWEFEKFGAKVAAFNLCGEPYLLIADHVKAPSKRLIYKVENLDEAVKKLKGRGWNPDGPRFEVPDGP